jgi:hypothetical protein
MVVSSEGLVLNPKGVVEIQLKTSDQGLKTSGISP